MYTIFILLEYSYDYYEFEEFISASLDIIKLDLECDKLNKNNYPKTHFETSHGKYSKSNTPHYYIKEITLI